MGHIPVGVSIIPYNIRFKANYFVAKILSNDNHINSPDDGYEGGGDFR